MGASLDQQLEFLRTLDGLKGIQRASPIIDRTRQENSAEHSWHVAMYALVLAEYAPADVDIGRVVQMLLLHDVVEIDAGDVPLHSDQSTDAQMKAERLAADRIFGILPLAQRDRMRALWDEFEAALTSDARFAKSLDRFQPLIQNLATGGGTWIEHSLTEQQVVERYGPQIHQGSPVLWRRARKLVSDFFATTPPSRNP
ncbi:HD domain-containing protein [Sulfitobacter sp. M220]|uniref:HD domain-containing protein n=1 Tax=Sulfitobacter sp. M220 TaxID=2675333 RepID=UPI001F37DE03|nr:HD domain-containing protein [Sulfitobacter sp. M220]MCF7778993.1 HD domain-containing protein [Sulfitobacter sp. M220]